MTGNNKQLMTPTLKLLQEHGAKFTPIIGMFSNHTVDFDFPDYMREDIIINDKEKIKPYAYICGRWQ